MVRGSAGSDSEEERHDRFRSERTVSSLQTGLDLNKKEQLIRRPNSLTSDRDSRNCRRGGSRDRKRSKERKNRNSGDREERRNENREQDRHKRKKTERRRSLSRNSDERSSSRTYYNREKRSRSHYSDDDKRFKSYYGEDRSSESHNNKERRSQSRYSDEIRNRRSVESKSSGRRSLKSSSRELPRTDTFTERFDRRRLSEDEERIEKTVVYWETTPSPERESKRHKKRSRGDKKVSKEKKRKCEGKTSDLSKEGELYESSFGPILPPRLELRSDNSEEDIPKNKSHSRNSKESDAKKKSKSSPKKADSLSDEKKKRKKESLQKKLSENSPSQLESANTYGPKLPTNLEEVQEAEVNGFDYEKSNGNSSIEELICINDRNSHSKRKTKKIDSTTVKKKKKKMTPTKENEEEITTIKVVDVETKILSDAQEVVTSEEDKQQSESLDTYGLKLQTNDLKEVPEQIDELLDYDNASGNIKIEETHKIQMLETHKADDKRFYGPIIPDTTKTPRCTTPTVGGESSLEEGELVSPVKPKVFGPTLPERIETVPVPEEVGDDLYGPVLPPTLRRDSDEGLSDEDIGPLPEGVDGGRALRDLERRAAILKAQMDNKDQPVESGEAKREEWMTQLPEARRVALGLGARKFRAKEGPDMSDRSSWSDTPAQKKNKQLLAEFGDEEVNHDKETRRLEIAERDKEMEKRSKQGKQADKSLLELHQKELKRQKKKEKQEDKKEERRPFSREIDLQSNRFDEAQKKSIIKKAQLLNSRFSSGESKYL